MTETQRNQLILSNLRIIKKLEKANEELRAAKTENRKRGRPPTAPKPPLAPKPPKPTHCADCGGVLVKGESRGGRCKNCAGKYYYKKKLERGEKRNRKSKIKEKKVQHGLY